MTRRHVRISAVDIVWLYMGCIMAATPRQESLVRGRRWAVLRVHAIQYNPHNCNFMPHKTTQRFDGCRGSLPFAQECRLGVWFGVGCTASCGWSVRCVGFRGDAWSVMLSPCNTLQAAQVGPSSSALLKDINPQPDYNAQHDNQTTMHSTTTKRLKTNKSGL